MRSGAVDVPQRYTEGSSQLGLPQPAPDLDSLEAQRETGVCSRPQNIQDSSGGREAPPTPSSGQCGSGDSLDEWLVL